MRRLMLPAVLTGAALLGGCVVAPPSGPTVMALPAQGKAFDAFQKEDVYCRQTAAQDYGGAQTTAAAQNNAVGSALVGTALGAGAGAAIGAATGNVGAGAAIGAGAGLLAGSTVGAGQAARGGYYAQQQYDMVYIQCMYSYGNTVRDLPMSFAGGYPYPYPYAYPYPYPYFAFGYAPGIVIGARFGPHFHHFHRWRH